VGQPILAAAAFPGGSSRGGDHECNSAQDRSLALKRRAVAAPNVFLSRDRQGAVRALLLAAQAGRL
jgi:hypothetical protein